MSNFFQFRIQQSVTGLDDVGMDLQMAQLSSQTDKEAHTRTTLSWLDWQLPFFVTLCAVAGTIFFTFLVSSTYSFLYIGQKFISSSNHLL